MGLACAAILCLSLSATAGAGPRIESVSGPVEIGSGEPPAFRPAREGAALEPGDVIRTGAGGRAALELDGRTVRLYENSLLRLPVRFEADAHEVELDEGRSLFDVIKGRNVPFRVRTPEVVVSVKGTRFLVDAGSRGGVSVFRGLVEVANALDAAEVPGLLVREGFAAVGGGARPLELLMQEVSDPWESWSEGGVAPKLPATETLESARSVLEQAILAEIETLDPELLAAPEPETTAATVRVREAKQARAESKPRALPPADATAKPRRQLPAALDPDPTGGSGAPDLGSIQQTVERAERIQPPLGMEAPGGGAPMVALERRARAMELRAAALETTPELDPVVDVARAEQRRSGPGAGARAATSPVLAAVIGSEAGSGLDPDDLDDLLEAIEEAGGPGSFPFGVQVLSEEALVLSFGGQSITLDERDIDEIEDGNYDSLGPFLGVIFQLGLDPNDVADLLDDLL
ncbi:MAG: FecR domain-containing protein [Myxococcota bacterium]|nr:FecR domain-containing protein [Myxococcota bacterium]